jgi:hypothetical protein
MIDWPLYFRRERNIRTLARRAGLPTERAAVVAERLAAAPLNRATAERLIAHLRERGLTMRYGVHRLAPRAHERVHGHLHVDVDPTSAAGNRE